MEENEEKKIDTEELKTQATDTVNQVKETIKKVDIKKDSMETKGFIGEMFKDPLGKIQEIVTKDSGKTLTYTIIIIVVWTLARLISQIFTVANIWGMINFGNSLLSILKSIITPVLTVIVMAVVVQIMNKQNKKSLVTVITAVTAAKIPVVLASIVSLITIIGSQASLITAPFSSLCGVISTVLMYFALKSIFDVEKNSEFIKKFVKVELVYYIVYIVLSFLGIYI